MDIHALLTGHRAFHRDRQHARRPLRTPPDLSGVHRPLRTRQHHRDPSAELRHLSARARDSSARRGRHLSGRHRDDRRRGAARTARRGARHGRRHVGVGRGDRSRVRRLGHALHLVALDLRRQHSAGNRRFRDGPQERSEDRPARARSARRVRLDFVVRGLARRDGRPARSARRDRYSRRSLSGSVLFLAAARAISDRTAIAAGIAAACKNLRSRNRHRRARRFALLYPNGARGDARFVVCCSRHGCGTRRLHVRRRHSSIGTRHRPAWKPRRTPRGNRLDGTRDSPCLRWDSNRSG